jgi:di/tricarboxylate transporter
VLDVIPVTLFIWYFRDVLLSSRRALWFLGIGVGLFAVALALEVGAATRPEDAVEVVPWTSVAVGMTILAVERLRPAEP